jgi:hypothetical protein
LENYAETTGKSQRAEEPLHGCGEDFSGANFAAELHEFPLFGDGSFGI